MHRKGLHCGSTAMGDALRRLGLDLPEETIFALGAGLGFSLHNGDVALSPPQASRFLVGRSASFESDLCRSTGATLHPEHFADANAAWERIEELLRRGELPLVYVDLFELPYMGAHGHWFGHLIAVASPQALVWDNEFAEPQRGHAGGERQRGILVRLDVIAIDELVGDRGGILHSAARAEQAGAAGAEQERERRFHSHSSRARDQSAPSASAQASARSGVSSRASCVQAAALFSQRGASSGSASRKKRA